MIKIEQGDRRTTVQRRNGVDCSEVAAFNNNERPAS